jgi:beta-mannosidase
VHHAAWKARSPRDLGAGWDFDDVRDHYVQRLFGVDPVALRVSDHERYLALGRLASGEVMAQAFAEWRRARSVTRGGLIWFLRDLWPGAGWGLVDASGRPKLAWYALRRALQPTAIAISDEGCNGLALHVAHDGPMPLAARLEVALYRGGHVEVGRGATDVRVAPHAALELPIAALFEGFLDLSFAYRFGRPTAQVVHATLVADGRVLGETFHFPVGPPIAWEPDVGLTASLGPDGLTVSAKRFAYGVVIELPGLEPEDNGFHLAPGQVRTIALRKVGPTKSGTVTCASSESSVRVEVVRA